MSQQAPSKLWRIGLEDKIRPLKKFPPYPLRRLRLTFEAIYINSALFILSIYFFCILYFKSNSDIPRINTQHHLPHYGNRKQIHPSLPMSMPAARTCNYYVTSECECLCPRDGRDGCFFARPGSSYSYNVADESNDACRFMGHRWPCLLSMCEVDLPFP